MGDVESQVVDEVKTKKWVLVLRTLFHCVYFCGDGAAVLVGGLHILGQMTGDHNDPLIVHMKKFIAALFTSWNFTFQIVFLGVSLLYDILEWTEHQGSRLGRRLKYWRDILFCSLVMPYAVFVTHMFWTVFAIDRELVFPQVFDEVVPWWFNHCVHTNTGLMVVLETLLQARPHPTNQLLEEALYWTVGIVYAVIFYTVYFTTNRWLYQVFGVMTWWQICLYQLYIWLSSYLVYKLQFPLNRLIHGTPAEKCVKEENKEIPEEEKCKDGDGTWSLKFRSVKSNVEGSRL